MENSIVKTIKKSIKYWYIPVVIGGLFVVSGFYIFSTPLASYATLSLLFASLFVMVGASEVIFALSNKNQMDGYAWVLFSGIIDLILGIVLLSKPMLSMEILPFYVGIVLLFRSMRAMGMAFDLKSYHNKGWVGLLCLGILGIIFALMMVFNVAFGALTIVYWTAITFIILGFYMIMYGFQMKSLKKHAERISPELVHRYEQIQQEIKKQLTKTE